MAMSNARAVLDRVMTEKQLQASVMEHLRLFGWTAYHTWLSVHSYSGFVDIIAIRPPRLIAIELKRQGKHPTEEQREWLRLFAACGIDTYVWQPSDLSNGEIDNVLR